MKILSPEAQIARREYMRKWRAANKDKCQQHAKRWREQNPREAALTQVRYWQKVAEKNK